MKRKLTLSLFSSFFFFFLSLSFSYAQCACDNNSCTMTIDSVYNGNLNLLAYDRVCIGPNGFIKGDIYLAWESKICNYGKIYGAITVEGKDCNGCGDENRLCNHGEIYFTKVTPGIHTRWHNYGIIKACGNIPGPKSFTINNYDGACLDVKGVYSITPGTSSSSIWRGNVNLDGFAITGGGNTFLDIYGSVVIKGPFSSIGSPPITMHSGSCMETGSFTPGSSSQFTMQSNTSLTTTAMVIGSAGLSLGNASCVKATTISNTGLITIGTGSVFTGTSLTSSNHITLSPSSSLNISGKITMTGAGEIRLGDQSFVSANDIDLQAAAKLRGPAAGYGHVDIVNDLTWCCGTGILGNLDMCISNDPNKKKITVGGQVVGPNVTWCASTIPPVTCSVTCPTHVTCDWSCCLALNVTGTRINASCGATDGSITINVAGGVAPYTYQWKDGVTTKNRTGLAAGSYWVTVLDKDSCMGVYPVNVYEQPCGPTVSVNSASVCLGSCASVTATSTGPGTLPYTYNWSDGKTGAGPHSFCPTVTTTYTVTLTDANNKTSTSTSVISIYQTMTLTVTPVNIKCNGVNNGSASVSVNGGTSPFTYAWAASGGTGSATPSTLSPGTYTVTVTDKNGCTKTGTATITQPPLLTATTATTVANCGGNTGTASVTPGGGTGAYTYAWSAPGGTGVTMSALGSGTYTVTVRDGNNCSATSTAVVTSTPPVTSSITASTDPTCTSLGSATVTAGGGTSPFTYTWASAGGTGATANNLSAGTYTVTVRDANNCTSTTTVTLTLPPNPTATTGKTDANCGQSNGAVSVTAGSGTAPYTYFWSSGSTASTQSNLSPNTYTVTITDSKGCTITSTAVVGNIPGPTAAATGTNLTCFGVNTGTASVTLAGGITPYSYAWSAPGSTASTMGTLGAGTYTVTVTDNKGCTTTSTTIITAPTEIVPTTTSIPATCGATNGSASVTATGGTGAYGYQWNTGPIGQTIIGLITGVYTVTVTDANTCSKTATVSVSNQTAISITVNPTTATCGGNDGAATITISGTGPFTHTWSTGATGLTISGVYSGSYDVTITDGNGCVKIEQVTINDTPAPTVDNLTKTPLLCPGDNNGAISVAASGGTGTLTYSWSAFGGTSGTGITGITGLSSGTYTVTIIDGVGCQAVSTANITDPPLLTSIVTAVSAVCGPPNGTVNVNPGGGTGAYTYNWSAPGGTSTSMNSLGAGTYTVTVTDGNGCTTLSTGTIVDTPAVTSSITANTNPTCVNLGSATVSPAGGTAPFTYLWSPSGGTGVTASNLIAGIYTVTVTDANNCTSITNVTLTSPPLPTATPSSTDDNCAQAKGAVSVVAGSGTTPYTYLWSSGSTTTTEVNLLASTYTVTVTDINGCTNSATAVVNDIPGPTAMASSTNLLCFGATTGTATVTPLGGTGTYTYNWSAPGSTGTTMGTLAAGTYTVTVTDNKGCTTTTTATITQPTEITPVTNSTDALCGSTDGTATVSAVGGTGTIAFTWSAPGGTTTTINGLGAGAYTVTATDANSCSISTTVLVNSVGGVSATIASSTNATCIALGDAVVTATGGTAPFTYLWSPIGGTGITGVGLSGNTTYTVEVRDANNCVSNTTVTIILPPNPTATTSKVDDKCTQAIGSVSVVAGVGTAPYTYLWSSGSTTTTENNLLANTYTVTVTDINGCTSISTATVNDVPGPTATASSPDLLCFGATTGVTTVTALGGTGAYTYQWAPGGGTGATQSNLSADIYKVTVTDNNGCTIVTSTTIGQPPQIVPTTNTFNAACGASDGIATVSAIGGTGALAFTWSAPGGTTTTINGLDAGIYTVTVTDANNCNTTTTALVNSTGGVDAEIQSSTNATCVTPGSAVVNTIGGTAPFTYLWSPSGGTGITGTNLAGNTTYTVEVRDANNCVSNTTVTITIPPSPTAAANSARDNCNMGVGSVGVTAIGGLAPYTYLWSTGATTDTEANLFAGTYSVTITDINGCTTTTAATVSNAAGPSVTISKVDLTCFGSNDGSTSVIASGGAGNYTYNWQPVASTNTIISSLSANIYSVTVTDAVGCTITTTTNITEPPQINVTTTTTDANCGASNGGITVTATGGTGTLTPTWSSPGVTGFTSTTLAAGTYIITITDATSCVATTTAIVGNVGSPTIAATQNNILCNGDNNGSVSLIITGGAPGYNIVWNPSSAGTGTSISNLAAGTYSLAVTDANSCQVNTVITISEPPLLVATANALSPNCPSSGTASVTATGGTVGYTYNWLPGGATTQTITVVATGIYSVTVTDANSCTQIATASVTIPDPIVLSATTIDGTCALSNGSASVTANGGTIGSGYSYSWLPIGGTGSTATGLPQDTYTVTVTDANGCTETTTAIVGNSPSIVLNSVPSNVSCYGGNDGSISTTVVGGTNPLTYSWTPSGGSGSNASSLTEGTYVVNVTDSKGCTAISTATITQPSQITLTVPAVGNICIGQSATLTAGAGGGIPTYTYLWMPGSLSGSSVTVSPSTTTDFTVTLTDSNGCIATSSVSVAVSPPLQVTALAGKSVCSGASTSVSASASGGNGTYTYVWQPGNFTGATFPVTPTGAVTYTVSVTDGCGTPAATSVATVQSYSPMLTPLFKPDTASGCVPICITFSNTSTGGTSQSCYWEFGDGGTTTSCSPTYCYRKEGYFNVRLTVTDTNGCVSTLTKSNAIRVHPNPTAGFKVDPKSASVLDPLINFYDESTTTVVKWDWSFGDVYNSYSSKKNPSHTYKDTGTYKVQQIVTTMFGCKDTAIDYVYIYGDYTFYVPNAFSPNGDGKNETFFPKGFMIDETCYKMMIFDRWGNLIFSTNDLQQGWDGRANEGEEVAQQDVYVWKIETCDYRKKKYRYIGHVTLVK